MSDFYQALPPEGAKILLVLFLSFLTGLEREEHHAGSERYSFGGVRTFPLIGLIGYAMAFLAGGQFLGVAVGFAVVCGLVVWFFRNPRRQVPTVSGAVVSPADGKIVTIEEVSDEFSGGRAICVGIFLSIFDVHINRIPLRARVIGLRYKRGKMLNALRPESARENEQLAVRIEEEAPPHRRMTVRQITGQFARRIVCWPKPGDVLNAGEQFGMIKLGSRTELVLPCETGLEITVKVGEKVLAGTTIVARYRN